MTGCYEKWNEISETTETSSVGKTEETTLQEAYANGLEDEEGDSIEKIEKYKNIRYRNNHLMFT